MKLFVEFISILSAVVVVLFALSQACLAFYYMKSKSDKITIEPAHIWRGSLPRVLLQLPIYNERYVVERLLAAVSKIDYPRELLTIQLLDDSTDETSEIAAQIIAKLALQGCVINHIRRVDRSGYKAGALQAGLAVDSSDFVAIFDADFVPHSNFIKEIIGYFDDPTVGMVQTRWEHLNEEYSLLTKLLSFAIDAHFSVEQGGRQAAHSFINFNGTAGMWRRATIDEAGGWQDDCLTEDLDLSFRAQLKGWRFLFVEGIATPSELPAQMSAIRTQQFRWTKGAAETGRKTLNLLWSSGQPLMTKIIGSFHMLNSFIFPFLFLISVASIIYPFIFGADVEAAFMPVSALMVLALIAIMFTYWTAHAYGQFASRKKTTANILSRAFLFMLIVSGLCIHNGRAVIQGLMGRATPFVRTPKLNVLVDGQKIAEKNAYKGNTFNLQNGIEIIMAIIFALLAIYSLTHRYYFMVPIYTYFACGYSMVSFYTVIEILENNRVAKT
jgi:cellulose synthase/poly-beta-1,6-N-acetylglucosamine synthase-like glycosyltransferase